MTVARRPTPGTWPAVVFDLIVLIALGLRLATESR
jgi:hypothetical protein